MQDNQEVDKHHENALQSVEMLRAVVGGGETYEAVAGCASASHARRSSGASKSVAVQLTQVVGVDGLKEEGAAFVRRLRLHRDAILVALEGFEPQPPVGARPARVLSAPRWPRALCASKGRTSRTWHDLALYYMLFATGLRPSRSPGSRCATICMPTAACAGIGLRADAAINGKLGPLLPGSRLDDALALFPRASRRRAWPGWAGLLRGLDPGSRFSFPRAAAYRSRPTMARRGRTATSAGRCWRSTASCSVTPNSRVEHPVGAPHRDIADVWARGRRGSGGRDPGHRRAQRGAGAVARPKADAGGTAR